MILVAGATGLLGTEICRRLRARDLPVRALARPGSPKAASLEALGVELARGDLRRRADLDAACDSVDAVITTATAMGTKDKSLTLRAVDREGQLQLVEAAKAAAVTRFVQVSVSPNLVSSPLVRYKREVERAVRASGMRWTVLQPSVFMEVWLSSMLGWDYAAGHATIFGDGSAPIAYVSLCDVAELAVRSLEDPRLENRDVPVGGPQELAPNEVLRIFERVAGKPFRVKRVPRPMLLALSPVVSLFSEMIGSGMGLGAQAANGDHIDSPVQRGLALPLTTVEAYVRGLAVGSAPAVTRST